MHMHVHMCMHMHLHMCICMLLLLPLLRSPRVGSAPAAAAVPVEDLPEGVPRIVLDSGLALLQDLDLGFGLLILGLELAHVLVRRTAQVLHHSVPLSGPSLIQNRSDGPVRGACIRPVNLAQTLLMLSAKDMCIAESMLVQPAVGRALQ